MDPIRVIGRIDLAVQVHAALVEAGADARLATAAPMAVIAQTGSDGTGVDVLANGFELCTSLKKAAPGRPVVMVTFEEEGAAAPAAAAYTAQLARTSRGPDAHVAWPATGRVLLEACERAVEQARVPRPRFSLRGMATRLLGIAILGALLWFAFVAGPGRRFEPPGPRARLALALVQAAIFAAAAWWNRQRARTSRRAGWHKGWAIFMVALAGLHLLKGALELVE